VGDKEKHKILVGIAERKRVLGKRRHEGITIK
jgi:hypothetical protein